MPLNPALLKTELKAAIESSYGKSADDQATLDKFCEAVANAVCAHIVANAVVTSVTSTPAAMAGGSTLAGTALGSIT